MVTVSDDLLLVTGLCPALELVLALLFTVVVDLGTVPLFCPALRFAPELLLTLPFERRDVPELVASCLPLFAVPDTDLLPDAFPVDVTDSLVLLPGLVFTYSASPSFLCSGCE